MPPLAQRNLFHDKVRLTVTLTGIVFSVVLIVVQLGLFIGFTTATSNLIDHSGADLWITSKNVPYVEQGVAFSERKLNQVRAVEGVADAQKIIARWTQWKRHDGGQDSVQIVGINVDDRLERPWNVVEGRVEDLKSPDAVILDELYKRKLGVTRVGEVFEVGGHRARVVGFTRGIRSFTTSPYVFTSFKNAQSYAGLREDQTMFILVKLAPGADLQRVRRELLEHVTDVEVFTTAQFSRMTTFYWMFTTGAGVAVLIAAALGLVVGFVVVAQTIYATTVDHIREFGTLKAMGAPNSYVYKVIMKQAAISAVIGYVLGMIVSAFVVNASQKGGAAILMPTSMAVGMFFLTLTMCVGAALVSINKVTRIDPAMVFRG
ncbi:MAG TPA: ABC transporter permease [Candidatus Sulfotelmatobacter sp.]|nr:ABC transporter permease [Candidatus Sulfotelmatobacter sp.]